MRPENQLLVGLFGCCSRAAISWLKFVVILGSLPVNPELVILKTVLQRCFHSCSAPIALQLYNVKLLSWIPLLLFSHSVMSDSFVTPWTVARQAPLSMRFPRQDD